MVKERVSERGRRHIEPRAPCILWIQGGTTQAHTTEVSTEELTRWPSADATGGGRGSYIDRFHFLKQGDLEGSLGLSHHDHWGNTARVWKSVLCLEGK